MPHRLTALPVLPEPLAPLGPLAHGLAAEWDDALAGLFRALAPGSGATAPLALLAAATPDRLTELAADEGYVEAIAAAVARESERLGAEAWYATLPGDRPRAIAYLSPEFGVHATRCRSTPAASACWPATTSRPPPTWACRSSRSASSTATATSAST